MVGGWTRWKEIAGLSLFALAAPFAAEAQVSLTQPNAGATFTAVDVCPFASCSADVPYSFGVSGAPVDSVSLLLQKDDEPTPLVIPLCFRADFDPSNLCPAPTFSMTATTSVRVGSWTLAVRIVRGTAIETSAPIPFTVTASAAARPGPVTIAAVMPNFASPAIRAREASALFPGGQLTTPDEIEIVGQNLANNPYLEVFLAPKPTFEPAISPQSEPDVIDWCMLRAEILERTTVGSSSVLRVRLPEVPVFMHNTCGFEPQGFTSSFLKEWRWVIRDTWLRPERVHEWVAAPPQRSHPGWDGPPFRLTRPAYPAIDGFQFRNQRTDATYKEFQSVFGNNAYICLGAFDICATRVPDPLYHLIWWPLYWATIDSTGGSCAGLAATSLLMAREELQPEAFDPDVHFPVGLERPDFAPDASTATYEGSWCAPVCGPHSPTNFWATVRMNHGVQISRQFIFEMLDTIGEAIFDPDGDISSVKGVPVATLERLRANPLGYVLCFFQPGKGHCVTPYRVDGNRIWIYDSNYPQEFRDTYIDIVDGDYHYPRRIGEPNQGNAIMAFPIGIWQEGRNVLGVDDFATGRAIRFLQMLAVGSADVIVTNDAGGRWGWEDDGTFTDNLLGAVALPPLGPPEEDVHQMPLMLAMNQPAPTVQINAKGGRYTFHTTEGRLSLQIEAADAQAGDRDRVRLAYASGRLAATAFTPARPATHVVARAGLAIGDAERALFHVIGVDVPAGRTVQVGGDVTARTLTYRNDTGTTTHHFVQLDYVAGPAEAFGRMLYGPFEVPQGASHRVVLSGWPDVSGVRAGLDFDSDGIVDRQQIVTGRPVVAPTDLEVSADLSIEKVASATELQPGDDVTYTVTVHNAGPSAATAVRLDDALPGHATVVQPTTTLGTCGVAALGLTCQLGSLAAGDTATVQYTVVPTRPGFVANGATITGAEGDPDWTNNTAVAVADVRAGIDVLPGSRVNPIAIGKPGRTPVAILGSEGFDVTTIDADSLRFGPARTPARQTSIEDVDADGFRDLLGHFERRESGLRAGDTAACVRGLTLLGAQFRGCDAIQVVPK